MTGRYPDAPRQDVADVLHGHTVPDPYRWLEDPADPPTREWQQAQDALFRSAAAGWALRPSFRDRLFRLTPGLVGRPAARGDRLFFLRRQPGEEHASYWVRDPGGEERALVDPAAIDPSLSTTLDGAVPSWEGDRLAYLLSTGGREESVLHVTDVATGEAVEDPIVLGRGPDLAWLPGGEELFCVRRLPDGAIPGGEEQFHRRVWRHRVGAPAGDDEMVFGAGRDRTTYYGLGTSVDGTWLVVSASLGTAPRNDVYVLHVPDGAWLTAQEGEDVETWASVEADGRLYLLTNRDAPRRRLCVADPRHPGPAAWRELLPQSGDVLAGFAVTSSAVVAVRTHDVASAVTVHDKFTGERRSEVSLPGLGAAGVVARPEGGDEVWIGYTDHARPHQVLHCDVATGEVSLWAEAPGTPADLPVVARQEFFASADGTRVPMFIVARKGDEPTRPRPTILYGYGGFSVALAPEYSATIAAWVQAGGVFAVANLRGGSEYGEEWHRAGMREHKQNVFDDFFAAAERLVADGWATPATLGAFGGSNGGLLVGAALTQRPELFRAVVCSAPLLDMVRYEKFGLGVTWNDEYGTAADPTELEWLLSWSPLHHVEEGVVYPAVLFTVFDGDTRVDPLHARKMCAALQAATAGPPDIRPVLLRRETDVGHGARAVSRGIDLAADELGFLGWALGLSLGGQDGHPGAGDAAGGTTGIAPSP